MDQSDCLTGYGIKCVEMDKAHICRKVSLHTS